MLELLYMRENMRKAIVYLPFLLPIPVACFAAVSVLLLQLDSFSTILAFLGGGILSVLCIGAAYVGLERSTIKVSTNRALYTLAALAVSGAWFVINANFTSQHAYVNRDPGIYSVTALWLTSHDSLRIPSNLEVFGDDHDVSATGAGFPESLGGDGEVSVQGAHGYPALLSLVGRVFGENLMFHVNPIFGAIGLLSVFGFAALIIPKLRWALTAQVLFGATLPLIYFSRDTYTEPVTMMCIFGALSFIALARTSPGFGVWLAAGVVAGAGMLMRIDMPLALAGIMAAAFWVALQKDKGGIRLLVAFLVPVAILYALSIYDLANLSSNYLLTQSREVKLQAIAIGGIMFVGFAMFALRKKLGPRVYDAYRRHQARIVLVAGYGFALAILLLISRPLWFVGHQYYGEGIANSLKQLQQAEGYPIDGMRNYAEHTLEWMEWYIGPAVLVLALIGFVLIVVEAVRTRKVEYLGFVAVVIGAGALYFNAPSITVDQIWASRRFLPVVIPGMVIAAAYALYVLEKELLKRYGIHAMFMAVLIAIASLLGILATTQPFVKVRTYDGQLAHARQVCSSIPRHSSLLLVGGTSVDASQIYRSVCNDLVVGIVNELPSEEELATMQEASNKAGRALFAGTLVRGQPSLTTPFLVGVEQHSAITFQEYERTLIHKPGRVDEVTYSFYLARVTGDGRLATID